MKGTTGILGEGYVAKFLKKRGYTILAKNYRTRFGEIDIVARDSKFVVFVEVKTRDRFGLSHPLEAITPSKQRKVTLAAESFLQCFSGELQPRFDVAAVYTQDGKIVDMDYIQNAFSPASSFSF